MKTCIGSLPWRLLGVACLVIPTVLLAKEPSGPRPLELWRSSDPGQRIVNGTHTVGFPSVVALVTSSNEEFCTATFIGCETVLTAAHCVCASVGANCQNDNPNPDFLFPPSQLSAFAQHAGFFGVSSIHVPTDYQFGVASDVAVLKLSAAVDGVAPSRINTTQKPASGTAGRLVGFGITDGSLDDNGIKRTGLVETTTCTGVPDATHVCWDFSAPLGAAGTDSNTCAGDSGGPLFVDFGAGDVVAGVTSGGESATCQPLDHAFDSDVFVNRTFIQNQAGADLSHTGCGGLAQAGSAGAPIFFGEGTLGAANDQDTFFFDVPAGSSVLRFTLNGEVGSGNDFDLYVKLGAAPTTSDFDCQGIRAGTNEFCEIPNPAPGTWFVLVDRFSGAGAYQTTVTIFGLAAVFSDGFESGDTSAWSSKVP